MSAFTPLLRGEQTSARELLQAVFEYTAKSVAFSARIAYPI
jgi:hypothetical protein